MCNYYQAGLSNNQEIRVFPGTVWNTGKYWYFPGNTGKYDIISYPMFVYGIRVCTYPESVVSHEAVGRMWYDWFRVGTNPYPVNKHGITILSFDHTLMITNLTKWMVTHIELVNINTIIIFNLTWKQWMVENQPNGSIMKRKWGSHGIQSCWAGDTEKYHGHAQCDLTKG